MTRNPEVSTDCHHNYDLRSRSGLSKKEKEYICIEDLMKEKEMKTNKLYKTKLYYPTSDPTPIKRPEGGDKTPPLENNNFYIYLKVLVFILIFIILVIFLNMSYNLVPNNIEMFKKDISLLKHKFRTQPDRMWSTLKASTHHILASKDPDRPAVIMMVLPNNKSNPMALCLARHFSHNLNKVLNGQTTSVATYPVIDGAKYVNYKTNEQKLQLDNSIQRIVRHHSSVIINHLEKLDSKTVMYFHGLCDTTEALHKRIAVIFLVETPLEIKHEMELASYLGGLWDDIDRVQVKPLLARIANNVIFLKQDDSFTNCQ